MKHFLAQITGLMVILFLFLSSAAAHGDGGFNNSQIREFDHSLDHIFNAFILKEPIHIILVEKNPPRLLIIENDYRMKVIAQFPCATGEKPGPKKLRGDYRTPEGIYFITKIYKDNKITIFGDKAFHLDYPNSFDIAAGRDGDGIYIHGTNKALKPNSTKGCITLRNKDLDKLVDFLNLNVTPVIIVQNLHSLKQRNIRALAEDKFDLTKHLLIPGDIDPQKVKFDYLYVVNDGTQTVAVAEISAYQKNAARTFGFSRGYLRYSPENGWGIEKRIWRPNSRHILSRYPLAKAAVRFSTASALEGSWSTKSTRIDWPDHDAGAAFDYIYQSEKLFAKNRPISPPRYNN